MTKRNSFPPVIYTCDGWIMGALKDVTTDDLKTKMIDGYAGTGGAFGWSIGDHEVCHFETEFGEILGDGYANKEPELHSFVHSSLPGIVENTYNNVMALKASCGGPMTALVKLCAEADLPFFPRVRMNSHYVIDPEHPGYGRFRRENPHLLIGRPDEELVEGTMEYGLRTGKNYARPEVRDYMLKVICECFERWDVDGVELDFMRHPGFFRIEEAYANRYLMTDLVERVRERLRQVGEERGRQIKLLVRVPPTIADSVRVGLDVVEWMEEDLVDIVIAGGGFIPFETPVHEFVAAARDTGALVYGCIEATRQMDDRTLRALCYRWLKEGADGVYLYNFYTQAPEWNRRQFDTLSDIAAMDRLDKRYELAAAGAFTPCGGHSCGFRYASPSTQMPAILDHTVSPGPVFTIPVADDLAGAHADDALAGCKLFFIVENFTGEDELEVKLNGVEIPWRTAEVNFDGWTKLQVEPLFWGKYPTYPVEVEHEGTGITLSVGTPPLRQGDNEIQVSARTNHSPTGRITLRDIHVSINYAN